MGVGQENEKGQPNRRRQKGSGVTYAKSRVRKPKDKPSVEGAVGNISTWITAALRNEQFFSLAELNMSIKEKLKEFNARPFQKKEGSRQRLFFEEERPLLMPLPSSALS